MDDLFKIKIIKARYECFWYSKHIGEVFTVKWCDEDQDDVIIMDNDYPKEGVMVNMAAIERDDLIIMDNILPFKNINNHKL